MIISFEGYIPCILSQKKKDTLPIWITNVHLMEILLA
jgi:hypothetical protein